MKDRLLQMESVLARLHAHAAQAAHSEESRADLARVDALLREARSRLEGLHGEEAHTLNEAIGNLVEEAARVLEPLARRIGVEPSGYASDAAGAATTAKTGADAS